MSGNDRDSNNSLERGFKNDELMESAGNASQERRRAAREEREREADRVRAEEEAAAEKQRKYDEGLASLEAGKTSQERRQRGPKFEK